MTRRSRWVVVVGAGVVITAVGGVISVLSLSGRGAPEDLALSVALPALVVSGSIILLRTDGVRIGLTLIAAGLAGVLSGPGSALTPATVEEASALNSVSRLLVAAAPAMFLVFLGLLLGVFPILFPTDRPLSERWARVLYAVSALLVVQFVSVLLSPEHCSIEDPVPAICIDNPIGFTGLVPLWFAYVMVLVSAIAGGSALVVRYRRASGVERLQIKWVVFSVAVIVIFLTLSAAVPAISENAYALGSLTLLVPIAIGVAVTRYRLYDIDRIIVRTVAYFLVGLLLAALYGLIAIGPVLLVGEGRESPPWLVAVATLAAFVAFAPLRQRVQTVVDRRFDRTRYDAEDIASRFSEQVRNETDLDSVADGLGEVTGTIFRPESLRVWVRSEA
jgi:hypothetical protein